MNGKLKLTIIVIQVVIHFSECVDHHMWNIQ